MADQGTDESAPARWNALGPDSNLWMKWDDDPRNSGTVLDGERATLLDYLRAYRLALELKCAGLHAEQLAPRSVPPSTMSLLGLVRHTADVERHWVPRVMARARPSPPYCANGADEPDCAG